MIMLSIGKMIIQRQVQLPIRTCLALDKVNNVSKLLKTNLPVLSAQSSDRWHSTKCRWPIYGLSQQAILLTNRPASCYAATLFNTYSTKSTNEQNSNEKAPAEHKNKSSEDESAVDAAENPEKLGLYAKFKLMFKQYWYVLLPVHCVTSAGWFGGFYYLSRR